MSCYRGVRFRRRTNGARLMHGILRGFCAGFIRIGSLEVIAADGTRFLLGDGEGEPLEVRFRDWRAEALFMLDPEVQFGQLFMDRRIRSQQGLNLRLDRAGLSKLRAHERS